MKTNTHTRPLLPLLLLAALSGGCAVKSVYVKPDFERVDKKNLKRLAVAATPLPSAPKEAAALLGVRSFKGWTKDERVAWRRWGVVVMAMKGIARWSAANRRTFAKVIRAKGGRRESDYLRRFDAHPRLRRALRRLAVSG